MELKNYIIIILFVLFCGCQSSDIKTLDIAALEELEFRVYNAELILVTSHHSTKMKRAWDMLNGGSKSIHYPYSNGCHWVDLLYLVNKLPNIGANIKLQCSIFVLDENKLCELIDKLKNEIIRIKDIATQKSNNPYLTQFNIINKNRCQIYKVDTNTGNIDWDTYYSF